MENVRTPVFATGDIAKYDGDCIVNSLGRRKKYRITGRIARSIIESANPGYQNEVCSEDFLEYGTIFETDSYGLPCKRIINVVAPTKTVDPKMYQLENIFVDIFRRFLELSKTKKIKSLSLPLIGAGGNGFYEGDVFNMVYAMSSSFMTLYQDLDVTIMIKDSSGQRINEDERTYNEERAFYGLLNEKNEKGCGRTFRSSDYTLSTFEPDIVKPSFIKASSQEKLDELFDNPLPVSMESLSDITSFPEFIKRYIKAKYTEDLYDYVYMDVCLYVGNDFANNGSKQLSKIGKEFELTSKDKDIFYKACLGATMTLDEMRFVREQFGLTVRPEDNDMLWDHAFYEKMNQGDIHKLFTSMGRPSPFAKIIKKF